MIDISVARLGRGLIAATCLVAAVAACDTLLTEAPDDADLFDAPVPDLTPEQMATFIRGDAEFGRQFAPSEGLGPIFNNVACAQCHSGDGRGRPENSLTRFSVGADLVPELGGPQLQTKAIPGAVAETLPAGVNVSVRLPPPVFGVGFIEAIPVDAILANADEDDDDGDGISGRPNWVTPPAYVSSLEPGGGPGLQLGRFSRKAQVSTLLEQVVEAYHQDMGVTTEFQPAENVNPAARGETLAADKVDDPEIPTSTVRAVIDYIRMLAVPPSAPGTPERALGLFGTVGCDRCHVPTFQTGPSSIAALANKSIHPYSDFLLHDMGDALADNRPDGGATGREWRTAPLWGMRLVRDFLNGDMFLLHDGRARTVDEAIRLHGGEAAAARDRYLALSAEDRAALIEFVESR